MEEVENKTADMKKYRREYYLKNKTKLDKYCAQKVICVCGCKVQLTSIPKHVKSNKHMLNMFKAEFDE